MKILKHIKPFYLILFSLFLTLAVLAPVGATFAVGKPDDAGLGAASARAEGKNQQNRLAEGKLKACQAKEKALQKRIAQTTKLAATMQVKFDAIAQRVETYYTSKVVPSGKTVANYDNLVADVQSKKAAIKTALTEAQNSVENFVCSADDPKAKLNQFRIGIQSVKSALKEYRISIKNLIVAVRSVVGTTEKASAGTD